MTDTTTAEVLEGAGLPADGVSTATDPMGTAPIDPAGDMSQAEAAENTPDWRASLPAELQSSPVLQKYTDVAGLAKAHTELESLRGTSIRIPGPDAGDDVRAEFYRKVVDASGGRVVPRPDHDDAEGMTALMTALGRPESADAYKAPDLGEDAPELDSETFDNFKAMAHEVGLTQAQLEKIVAFDANRMKASIDAQRGTVEQQQQELAGEWGMAYQPRLDNTVAYLERSGAPQGLRDAVANKNVDKATMEWLHGIVSQGAEGATVTQQPQSGSDTLSPGEAEAQRQEVLTEWGKLAPSDPRYAVLSAKFAKLSEMALAGSSAPTVL